MSYTYTPIVISKSCAENIALLLEDWMSNNSLTPIQEKQTRNYILELRGEI